MTNQLERLGGFGFANEDADVLFDALSHPSRRFVLARLDEADSAMALADLACDLATRERGGERAAVPDDAIESAQIALYHVHVPKLADAGVVEFEPEHRTVALADGGSDLAAHPALPSLG